MPEHVDLLAELTQGLALPHGTDRWGIRTKASRNGFQWPRSGWIEAPGPILEHTGDAPLAPGDGLCLAYDWLGMATGSAVADDLLLVAFRDVDRLSAGEQHTARVRRAYVVTAVDGLEVVRERGLGANLARANLASCDLTGAVLYGADLSRAGLSRTKLVDASLYGADLRGADMRWTDLSGADLRYADLSGANLSAVTVTPSTRWHGANLGAINAFSAPIFTGSFLPR